MVCSRDGCLCRPLDSVGRQPLVGPANSVFYVNTYFSIGCSNSSSAVNIKSQVPTTPTGCVSMLTAVGLPRPDASFMGAFPFRGVVQLAERGIHNPEVDGSSPSPASKERLAADTQADSGANNIRS